QQGNECLLEHIEVGVHADLRIAADEADYRIAAQQHRGIEDAEHQLVLEPARGIVRGQHVIEVAELRQPDTACPHRALHPCCARGRERLSQVECIGDRVEQLCSRHVALCRMQSAGQLDVGSADL